MTVRTTGLAALLLAACIGTAHAQADVRRDAGSGTDPDVAIEDLLAGLSAAGPDAGLNSPRMLEALARLEGMDVHGEDGAVIGRVEEVVRSDNLVFLRIAFDPGLAIEDDGSGVPLSALEAGPEGRLVYPGIEAGGSR
ncbi:hypothetical protein [Arenibaculum sp.]|uniref:hypothetical protein n=1 Tax=Arenibaculum sp. TaxID=2865862 RepID=UPI002E0F5FAD|nr:hypothetical protein [Arenibaculum sp.]